MFYENTSKAKYHCVTDAHATLLTPMDPGLHYDRQANLLINFLSALSSHLAVALYFVYCFPASTQQESGF